MTNKQSTSFYGKWIIVGGFILFFFGIGLAINTVGIFIEEVTATLGFEVSKFSLFFSIAAISMTVSSIIVGKLIEKFNIKAIMGVCTSLFTAALILYSQCRTLSQFYLVSVLLGMGSAGTHIIPVTTMINNWFDKKRGLAMGIVFAGTGIGGLVLNPVVNFLIETNILNMEFGWQSAYVISGIAAGLVCIPTAIFLMHKTPEDKGQCPDGVLSLSKSGETKTSGGFTLSEAIKHPAFWLIAGTAFLFSMVNMGINQHLYSYFKSDIGFSGRIASLIVGAYLGMTVFGKISLGYISDKRGLPFGISMFIAITIAGILILVNVSLLWVAVIFILVFGFGNVIQTVIPPLVTANCFGLKQYSIIYGIISIFMTLGSAVGTPVSGLVREKTGSYSYIFLAYAFCLALSLILVLTALKLIRRTGVGSPQSA